jgi:hypothetical protein
MSGRKRRKGRRNLISRATSVKGRRLSRAPLKKKRRSKTGPSFVLHSEASNGVNALFENVVPQSTSHVSASRLPCSRKVGLLPPLRDDFKKRFIRNGVTIVGGVHLYGDTEGSGNQDYFGDEVTDGGIVLVVCDGCGSTPDSSTGARSGVRMVRAICAELLQFNELTPQDFARELQQRLVHRIRAAAKINSGERGIDNALYASYLFTIIIAVVTPRWYAVFRCGDGYFVVNGEVTELSPRPGNKPEYLAYLASDAIPDGFENITLEVAVTGEPKNLQSIMIATDGCKPLFENRVIGFQLADIWSSPKLRDENALRAVMNSVNLSRKLTISSPLSIEEIGKRVAKARLFSDDATLMVLLRSNIEDVQSVSTITEKFKGEIKKPMNLIKAPQLQQSTKNIPRSPSILLQELQGPTAEVFGIERRESEDESMYTSIAESLSAPVVKEPREERKPVNLAVVPIKGRRLIQQLWRRFRRSSNR